MSHKKINKKDKEEKNTIICGMLQRKIKLVFVLTIIFILLLSSSSTLLASVVDDVIISIKNANSTEKLEQLTAQAESLESNIEETGNEVNQTENEIIQDHSEEREIQYTEEYLKWLNSSDEEKKAYGNVIPRKEFVPFNEDKEPYKEQSSEVKTEEGQNNNNESSNTTIVRNNKKTVALSESSSLPSRYRLNEHYDITVEDQGKTGWCWAYASLKSLQTHLKVKGFYNPITKTNIKAEKDFSEWHLAYKASKYGINTGGNFSDFTEYAGLYDTRTNVHNLNTAQGPVLEDNITETISNTFKNGIEDISTEYIAYTNSVKPDYKVTKVMEFASIIKKYNNGEVEYYFPGNVTTLSKNSITEFRNSVKSHIKNYGGIYAATSWGDNYSGYNGKTSSLYNENAQEHFHAVTIVGWDDGYSRYNFNEGNRPQNNGAYIAVNSYGEGNNDNGYIYISYDDFYVERELGGILEVQRCDQMPDYEITQERISNSKTIVSVNSSQRLRFRGTPDENGYYKRLVCRCYRI